MKFNENPYYNPELCGLEIFESIDTADSYEFDMFVVWKKIDDTTLWWDTDSGCSCPTPFDPEDDRHHLKPITQETFFSFNQALEEHWRISSQQYNDFLKKVKDYTGYKL